MTRVTFGGGNVETYRVLENEEEGGEKVHRERDLKR